MSELPGLVILGMIVLGYSFIWHPLIGQRAATLADDRMEGEDDEELPSVPSAISVPYGRFVGDPWEPSYWQAAALEDGNDGSETVAALDVDMTLVDQDALETFAAFGRTHNALLAAGKAERNPEVEAILHDLATLVVYALGTRKYRQGGHN